MVVREDGGDGAGGRGLHEAMGSGRSLPGAAASREGGPLQDTGPSLQPIQPWALAPTTPFWLGPAQAEAEELTEWKPTGVPRGS